MKRIFTFVLLLIFLGSFSVAVDAAWLFSNKNGKWVNLKKKPKETPKLQFDYAKSLEEKGEYKEAIKEYDKFIYNFSPSPLVSEARFHMGICYENLGRYSQAFKQYKKILNKDISYENIREVIKREYQIGNLFFSGTRGDMWGGIPSITSPLQLATEVFEDILKNAPYSKYAVKSLFKIGEIKRKKKKYKEAIEKFKKVRSEYNNPEYKEAALFQIALCKYLLSKGSSYSQETTVEAVKVFTEFIKEYPESSQRKEAEEKRKELNERYLKSLYDKADFYEKQGKNSAALIYYQEIVEKFDNLEQIKKAKEKIEELKDKKEE
jgi:outer membrane assembly lipoprotein YfiO